MKMVCSDYKETSLLICSGNQIDYLIFRANQWSGFSMMKILVVDGLKKTNRVFIECSPFCWAGIPHVLILRSVLEIAVDECSYKQIFKKPLKNIDDKFLRKMQEALPLHRCDLKNILASNYYFLGFKVCYKKDFPYAKVNLATAKQIINSKIYRRRFLDKYDQKIFFEKSVTCYVLEIRKFLKFIIIR